MRVLFPLVVVVLFGAASAHPDALEFLGKELVDCHNFPEPMSYHVHVTYMLSNPKEIEDAVQLREEALKAFKPLLGEDPWCPGTEKDPSGRYDNGRLCMINDHDITNTQQSIGPFPIGEWSMWMPVHYYHRVVPWFLQHRGRFSVLVHPNTGCEYEDHDDWAQWTGSKWNLDFSIFKRWTQTESFGKKLGTAENPSCLPTGGICGAGSHTAPGFGPQISCCNGLKCNCRPGEDTCSCEEGNEPTELI